MTVIQNLDNETQIANDRQQEMDGLLRRFHPVSIAQARQRARMRTKWAQFRSGLPEGKRATDCISAILLLTLTSPVLLPLWAKYGLQRKTRQGRFAEPFEELNFGIPNNGIGRVMRSIGIHRAATLWNIVRGDMSFIGPRPVRPTEMSPREREVRKRNEVRPGLICLWWLRERGNITYQSEIETDVEYVDTRSMRGDLGIFLRASIASLYGGTDSETPEIAHILKIPLDNLTMQSTVNRFVQWADEKETRHACFVNADCANIACRHPEYLSLLQEADLVLADGIGLRIAGKLLKQPIQQNVNGTDLFPMLCETLSGTGKGLYLLGARPGVAQEVGNWVKENYPDVVVSGTRDGFFTADEEEGVVSEIANSDAQILLVAMGAPHQDLWIARHRAKLGVGVAVGVGGLFDFYSGRVSRAPMWMREVGLEWMFRLINEPGRLWKRYVVGNVIFLSRVLVERRRVGNNEGLAAETSFRRKRPAMSVISDQAIVEEAA